MPMPTAPDGHFFRVKRGPFGIFPWVELRRKVLFWSEEVAGSHNYGEIPDGWTIEETIEWHAQNALNKYNAWRTMNTNADNFAGDYPPEELP